MPNVVFGGSGENRTADDHAGHGHKVKTTIMLTVSDGGLMAERRD